MKRVYERPMMFAQEFTANEYVAACGDSGTVYKFTCDAGDGRVGEVVTNNGQKLGHYHACGTKHEAESTDSFLYGTYSECENYDTFVGCIGGHKTPVPVVIWRGSDNNNVHCTTNLNTKEWETAKS